MHLNKINAIQQKGVSSLPIYLLNMSDIFCHAKDKEKSSLFQREQESPSA